MNGFKSSSLVGIHHCFSFLFLFCLKCSQKMVDILFYELEIYSILFYIMFFIISIALYPFNYYIYINTCTYSINKSTLSSSFKVGGFLSVHPPQGIPLSCIHSLPLSASSIKAVHYSHWALNDTLIQLILWFTVKCILWGLTSVWWYRWIIILVAHSTVSLS